MTNQKIDTAEVIDLLASLSDRSLVVSDTTSQSRQRLLETVRQYGRDLLHEQGEAERIRKLHVDYFLCLAETSAPKLKGPQQMETLRLLDAEDENLRSALEWSTHGDGSEEGLRLAASLITYWWRQGHLVEGTDWCLRACATKVGLGRSVLRARVLNGAGFLNCFQGEGARAKEYFLESIDILTALGERQHLAESLSGIGFAAFFMDDYETSKKYMCQAYEVATEVGDRWYAAWSGYFKGILVRVEGDFDTAIQVYKDSILIYRQLGDRIMLSYPMYDIGLAEYYRGNLDQADKYLQESLSNRRDTQDVWGIAESAYGLGLVKFGLRDLGVAKELFGEAVKVGRAIGDKTRVAISLHWLGRISFREGDLGGAWRLQSESISIYREVEDRWGLAHNFAGFAELIAGKENDVAVKLWSLADKLRDDIGSPLPPYERTLRDTELAEVRATMAEGKFDQSWESGRLLSIDKATEMIAEAVHSLSD